MTPDRTELLIKLQGVVADTVSEAPCTGEHPDVHSCIVAQHGDGVLFLEMDPRKMCDACELYWHASAACALLDKLRFAVTAEEQRPVIAKAVDLRAWREGAADFRDALRCACGHAFDEHGLERGHFDAENVEFGVGGGKCLCATCHCAAFTTDRITKGDRP